MSLRPIHAGDARRSSDALPSPADREARNPFYRYLMHLGLPLSVSLVVHSVLIVLLTLKTFQIVGGGPEVGQYEASLTSAQLPDPFSWSESAALDMPEEPIATEWSLDSLTSLRDIGPVSERDFAGNANAAGEGSGDAGLGIGDGALTLLGTGSGAGEAGTGGLGAGLGGGDARIGQAGVWDLNVRANSIVYVVDYSGSLIVAVDELKRELKRSVGRLKPTQTFNVVLFYKKFEDVVVESFRPKLEPATEDVRREFFTWIDRRAPQGDTQPVEAVRRALAMTPEVVFLFSDGMFTDPERDEAEINRANARRGARIYCLVFDEQLLGDPSGLAPRETEGSRRLARIAEANGGKCKIVTAKDIGK